MRENRSYYAILGLLSLGLQTGYEIKQRIEKSLSHFWYESYGQIYPNLKKLVQEGLAETKTDEQVGKPDRIVYSITDKGQEVLNQWLQKPIVQLPPEKNELLLKLYFGRNLPVEYNIRHIEEYQKLMKEVDQIFQQIQQMNHVVQNEDQLNYGILTLTFGGKVVQAILEWCEETLKKLERYQEEVRDE